MARTKAAASSSDPFTARPLPQGVGYRRPLQYRARKLVDGQRITKTFESSRFAREWLEETAVRVREMAEPAGAHPESCDLQVGPADHGKSGFERVS